jgi:hypothetical protein
MGGSRGVEMICENFLPDNNCHRDHLDTGRTYSKLYSNWLELNYVYMHTIWFVLLQDFSLILQWLSCQK